MAVVRENEASQFAGLNVPFSFWGIGDWRALQAGAFVAMTVCYFACFDELGLVWIEHETLCLDGGSSHIVLNKR